MARRLQAPKRDITASYLRNYDLVSLRLLLAAIEGGNLAKVATQEGISLSAVSRRISALEARIGVQLLQRHDRGVSATEAALASLPRLRSLFDLVDLIVGDFEEISSGSRGVVRVRAHLTAIIGPLSQRIVAFTAAHPQIQVIVDEANSPDVVHSLQTGGCDIGFVSGTVATADLETFAWMTDALTVVTPVDHPLAAYDGVRFSQLLDYPFVGLSPASSLQTLFRGQAAAVGRTLNEAARVSTFEGVLAMVAAGIGIGIVPKAAIEHAAELHDISLHRLDESWAGRPLMICTRDRAHLPATARLFLDHMLNNAPPVC